MRTVISLGALAVGVAVAAAAFAYTAEQAERGQKVFAANCAECHGADGHGGRVPDSIKGYAGMRVPPVAGPGALPHMATAENVYTFIKQHMPLQKPGSLTDQDYLDIVAFDLKANNVTKPNGKPLTVQDLPAIKLQKK